MTKQLQIHNSTAEFLIFQAEDKAEGIQVFYQDENIWATQEVIATLFDKGRSTITEHLKNIFASGELDPNSVCRKFRQTASDGKNYEVQFYNLDAIISVGYRVNSVRAKRHIPMTMEDWSKRIDAYLNSDERPLLQNAGSVSHEQAQAYAETEFEKYRVIQDRLFESDFDRFVLPTLPFEGEDKE